jgi:hypothetical protein
MSTPAFIALVVLALTCGCRVDQTLAERGLLQVWQASDAPVKARADAVNRCFTNGTPIPRIVAVLGNGYSRFTPFSAVWAGPGPEPRKTSGLIYQFGAESVVIGTTADISADPLSGAFTGAGYSLPVTASTNTVGPGQP